MTRREIRDLVRQMLAETSADDSFWQDSQLNLFINSAYQQIVLDAELMHCTSTTPSVAEQADYQIPADALLVLRVWYDGEKLKKSSPEELDDLDPGWLQRTCEAGRNPTHWIPRGQMIRLYPAPSESGKEILLWAIQSPRILQEDTASPEIQEAYHLGIAMLAAYYAAQADYTNQMLRAASAAWLASYRSIATRAAAFSLRREIAGARLRDVREEAPRLWQT